VLPEEINKLIKKVDKEVKHTEIDLLRKTYNTQDDFPCMRSSFNMPGE